MDKKLKSMFEYQKFERNAHLEKLINETEARYSAELSDEDVSMVNAAGEGLLPLRKPRILKE